MLCPSLRLFSLSLLLITSPWAAAWSGIPALPSEITTRTLDNGVRVVIKENHGANLVSLGVWVRAGSRCETRETNGVSHVLEHLVFRGTTTRSADEVRREVEGVGGYLNAETSRDSTHFEALVAAEFFEPTLAALADTVLHPKLSAEDLAEEQKTLGAELSARLEDPSVQCTDLLFGAAFKKHPYGLPPGGTPLSVRRLDIETVRDYHTRYYVGPNMSVVVVGDLDATAALAAVEKHFAAAPNRQPPATQPPAEEPLESTRTVSQVAPIRQAVLAFGFHAPGIGTPQDVLTTDVLLTALGEGATSLLFQRLRSGRRPLVSAFQVDFLTQKDPGLFTVTCVLPRATVNAVQTTILKTLEEVREQGLTDKQLELAKNVLEGMYTYQNETAAGQASSLGFYEAIDTHSFAVTYIDEFRKVSAAQVQDLARRYFDPNHFVRSIVAPPQPSESVEARLLLTPGTVRPAALTLFRQPR